MVFQGYIDESGDAKIFTLSCLLSKPSEWMWFESAWKKCLRATNRSLKSKGRPIISRYHAADCSSRKGEFRDWTTEEQVALTMSLLSIFARHFTYVVSYSISLEDFKREFPDSADAIADCYLVLLKF